MENAYCKLCGCVRESGNHGNGETESFNFDGHITVVLSICSQRMYLTKLLNSQGMLDSELHDIQGGPKK